MQAGTSVQFTATVKNYKQTNEVTWSLADQQSENTTIDQNGVLTIDEKEGATQITVIATSAEDPKASASMQIAVISPYTLKADTESLYPGDTVSCTVYYKDEPLPAQDYTWSIETENMYLYGNITSADTKIENGLLTVGADETCTGLKVKAKSETGTEYAATVYTKQLYSLT